MPRSNRGEHWENVAAEHIRSAGLRLSERNYNCRMGEIDLIAEDGDTLVFIEVRYRRNRGFGSALESVDSRKQLRLREAALHYLTTHPKAANRPLRFDVIAIEGPAEQPRFEWVQSAFE